MQRSNRHRRQYGVLVWVLEGNEEERGYEYVYYNVFSSYNPLKKDPLKKEPLKKEPLKKEPLKKEHLKKESSEPFPWMAQADKKKTHIKKHRKEE